MKKKSNRKAVVFTTLIGVLTLTSALLLALQPAPLTPENGYLNMSIDGSSMNAIFQTQTPVKPGRWKYIYVHHSRTPSGSADTLIQGVNGTPDHFVIGNGNGAADGQIEVAQRWDEQVSATAFAGTGGIDPACISICLVGDFDHSVPTPKQIQRLTSLVNTLQGRFDIPSGQVVVLSQNNSRAGIGQYFPATAFREQLLP